MRLLAVLSILVALVVVGGGLDRDEGGVAVVAPGSVGAGPPSDVGVAAVGTEPHRRGVTGTLVEVSADGMMLETETERVFVRFADETRICRDGCEVTWRDLRVGDRIVASAVLGVGEPVRVADWVDANATSGFGVVTAVEGDALSVVLSRPGQASKQRTLLLEPYTRVRGADGEDAATGSIEVGDSFYFTGAGETPGATEIWVYLFWENS